MVSDCREEGMRAAMRSARSPCGSMSAKPLPCSRSWRPWSQEVDFPVPVLPMM